MNIEQITGSFIGDANKYLAFHGQDNDDGIFEFAMQNYSQLNEETKE